MAETLFISDLHLSPERPQKLTLFKQLLTGKALLADTVYILGDLFEDFWAGIDDQTPPNPDIIATLKTFTDAGGKLSILRGNRELVLNEDIEVSTGCTLLNDGTVIDLYGEKVLIMHGDVLCTRDVKYQRYRRFMETSFVKSLYLSFPYRLRILLAHGLKPAMKKSAAKKTMELIDVEQNEVEKQMRVYGILELIHGHTHRPNFHDFALDGVKARRIVLGDWYDEDSVLVCNEREKKLMRVEEYLRN